MQLNTTRAALLIVLTFGGAGAFAQYPHHVDDSKIVITRGDEVLGSLPCERITLDGGGRWTRLHSVAYIRAHIARTSDGRLYAHGGGPYGAYWVVKPCPDVFFMSEDEGRTWPQRWNVDLLDGSMISALTVLTDDTFLVMTTDPDNKTASFFRSTDRGRTWTFISQIESAPFKLISVDGNLLQLHDGSLIAVAHFSVPAPQGSYWGLGLTGQFVLRSTDGGKTWAGGPDRALWSPLIENKLTVVPVGPDSRVPGGTFPGCYETGIAEEASGRLVAALRFSGPQHPWHKTIMKQWGGRPADGVGRIFRQVMFSSSEDGGRTWETMRPFFDPLGEPVIIQQETNGQLVPLGDGRVALIHQRRFGPFQIVARFSIDHGRTWLPDEYRLNKGFGFTTSVLLDDGTIVTATGQSIQGQKDDHVSIIRWKPPAREVLLAKAKRDGMWPPKPNLRTDRGLSLVGVGGLSESIDVKKYHTYKIRLSRADPKALSPDDLIEVFVDDSKVGQVHRRQLAGDGYQQLAFGDNDSSSPQEIESDVMYSRVVFAPGDDMSSPLALEYSAGGDDPSPTAQGWSQLASGAGGEGRVVRDDQTAAWHITSRQAGKIQYHRPLTPAHFADPRGWTLIFRCRIVERANAGSCSVYVRDDRNTIGLSLAK